MDEEEDDDDEVMKWWSDEVMKATSYNRLIIVNVLEHSRTF